MHPTGLLQIQLVQLYLNQLFVDKDAPTGDIHNRLMETCYLGGHNDYKIVQGLQRKMYGPIKALNLLIEDSRLHNFCLWHGSLCDSTSRNKETGSFESIYYCPDCTCEI